MVVDWGRGAGGPRPRLFLCLQFPLGPGPEGPMAAMSAMEPHHVNGSLGEWASGDADTHTPAPAPLLREPRAPPGGLLQPVRLCVLGGH